MVEARLAPDMLPLRFQIISVAQHSRGAIEGVQSGNVRPPSSKTPYDYAGLQGLVAQTREALSAGRPRPSMRSVAATSSSISASTSCPLRRKAF